MALPALVEWCLFPLTQHQQGYPDSVVN